MDPDETGPPVDPEDWSDEEWLAWLRATDPADRPAERPATTAGRLTHSAGGQVLGTAMLAMAQAIYGRRDDEIVVVVEGASEPTGEDLEVHLDPDHPERSTAVVRPTRRRGPA